MVGSFAPLNPPGPVNVQLLVPSAPKVHLLVTISFPPPLNDVAAKSPVLELNVRLVPLFAPRFPVAAVANSGKQVVSDDSSAIVIVVPTVAVAALPEQDQDEPDALPVNAPINVVAVTIPAIDAAAPTMLVNSTEGEPLRPVAVPVKGPENPVAVVTPVIITP